MRRLWLRWVLLIAFVAVLGVAFVSLGNWQLDRLAQRKERNATTIANEQKPMQPYEQVFTHPITDSDQWQRVEARGTFDADHQFVVRYRSNGGVDGYEVVTPLRTASGAVLVDRGFIPLERGTRIPSVAPAPPAGEVTVVGHVRRNEKGRRAAITPVGNQMRLISQNSRVAFSRSSCRSSLRARISGTPCSGSCSPQSPWRALLSLSGGICGPAARRTWTPPRRTRQCEDLIMDLGLTDRAFLVTAASTGLGRATAQHLVAEGARVVLVARRAELLAEAVSQMGTDRAVALAADLTDSNTAETACALALDAFGRLDGALISVGGPPAGSVLSTSEEQWRGAFESVFLAALRTCRTVVRRGTASDLCIAWVLSTSVKTPAPGLATSNGLRPGLAMLVKQLADELGPQGTRVIGLMPGAIETERARYLNSLKDDPDAARASAEASIPLRRYGRPEEFGRVAAFVLSPAASYLTGSVIAVEGGAQRAL